jgi:hypothetical protein
MIATATAAADTRLPAIAAVLASALISISFWFTRALLAAAVGEFVTPVGVLSAWFANNFSQRRWSTPRLCEAVGAWWAIDLRSGD